MERWLKYTRVQNVVKIGRERASGSCICINEQEREAMTGIGGWLIVIIMHLVTSLFYYIYSISSNSLRFNGFSSIKKSPFSPLLGLTENIYKLFLSINIVVEFILIVIIVLCLVSLFFRKRSFKKYYRLFVFLSLTQPLLIMAFMFWYAYHISMTSVFLILFSYPIAMVYICLPYLERSKRVRLTFVN
ncbi:DUF2569 family protein [Serratia sp. DD3]|uniref:DUF2569 family protein n=1 Tax=Serratia sp. DD3 TaxID=1410619 RepID=UPI0004D70627|nr:hypothetical protein SRDD_12340 [Serratia sp. DD3]